MLIDPPTPFDTIDEWEDFLHEMQAVQGNSRDVQRHIVMAMEAIAKLRAGGSLITDESFPNAAGPKC